MLLLAKPISIHALREEGDTGHSLIAGDSAIFLSTPSARRATRHLRDCACDFRISIHALREEGDQSSSTRQAPEKNFYPRPPRGGRRSFSRRTLGFFRISIHALREEGDELREYLRSRRWISIHALREEGDFTASYSFAGRSKFLSTPSARRATLRRTRSCTLPKNFYPRPPRGGRHDGLSRAVMFQLISIHALREEGDGLSCLFQQGEFISIHALREEGDPRPSLSSPLSTYFYPRPPRGGRPADTICRCMKKKFLSTPSARRATQHPGTRRPSLKISIHALREEGD